MVSYVTKINDNAFQYRYSLTSVVIPDSVTSIGAGAFKGCNIKDATIPAIACSYIKGSSLRTLVITSGDTIAKSALSNCTNLTSVVIGDSVTSIERMAFYGCTNLISLTIGNSVKTIGDYAFYGCSSLTSVVIPDYVTLIDEYAFYNCTSLTSVVIPDSVVTIDRYAFAYSSNLTIYCEVESKPNNWDSNWNYSNCTVVWGYKPAVTA